MTIPSSINRPIPAASPPSVIMLNVSPAAFITRIVIAIVHGTTSAAISALSADKVNMKTTSTASTRPSKIASRTLRADSATSAAWSYETEKSTSG